MCSFYGVGFPNAAPHILVHLEDTSNWNVMDGETGSLKCCMCCCGPSADVRTPNARALEKVVVCCLLV